MDLQLRGRRAIVTGGSRGIGLAVARSLAAEGADVALVARDPHRLEQAAEAVGASGVRVLALSADTTDPAAVERMVATVVERWGGVDVLVNAAARPASAGAPTTLAATTDEALLTELDTKVLGYLRCARAVAPHMVAAGWGRIVNVSGLNARSTGSIAGSIRNVAVAAMTKNLADELGPSGVNVTVVHPGRTVTERTPVPPPPVSTSIGRMVTADEVAAVVTFLASPLSVAVTGDAVAVGGGTPGAIYY
ncbi:short-subunit dehydrogenase [Motilibacter peucedani]|uniref:Short-subunit dehydrogenase n=1 Tax=Motilibacter peucedani TaxID=598650 RepID=A0A420XLR8_9ACTN|nr:SDR family NAD(P)-dependent oxidoreductase [Motilibacter peucedani]RKS71467.1 short-subunit dehydrogenase [Motilibacter peucedani]